MWSFIKKYKSKEIKNGKYEATGGHVESGEFGRQALIREFKEELGIEISDKDIKNLY